MSSRLISKIINSSNYQIKPNFLIIHTSQRHNTHTHAQLMHSPGITFGRPCFSSRHNEKQIFPNNFSLSFWLENYFWMSISECFSFRMQNIKKTTVFLLKVRFKWDGSTHFSYYQCLVQLLPMLLSICCCCGCCWIDKVQENSNVRVRV